jgi:hypothetical protein
LEAKAVGQLDNVLGPIEQPAPRLWVGETHARPVWCDHPDSLTEGSLVAQLAEQARATAAVKEHERLAAGIAVLRVAKRAAVSKPQGEVCPIRDAQAGHVF